MSTPLIESPFNIPDGLDAQAAPTVDWDQEPERPPAAEPEAPYGVNPRTGKPYKIDPAARKALGERLAASRREARGRLSEATTPKTRAKRTTSKAPRAPQPPTYEVVALGLMQIPAMGLGMLSRFSPSFGLDSLAVTYHAPSVASAVAQVAVEVPQVADLLDRASRVGPYGALGVALMPLVLQLAANHGLMAPVPSMGIMGAEELMATVAPDTAEAFDGVPA